MQCSSKSPIDIITWLQKLQKCLEWILLEGFTQQFNSKHMTWLHPMFYFLHVTGRVKRKGNVYTVKCTRSCGDQRLHIAACPPRSASIHWAHVCQQGGNKTSPNTISILFYSEESLEVSKFCKICLVFTLFKKFLENQHFVESFTSYFTYFEASLTRCSTHDNGNI